LSATARYPGTISLSGILLLCAVTGQADPLPGGTAHRTVDIDGAPIELHTYKPEHYGGGPLLVTLHGLGRNAGGYRDYAKPLADRLGLLVVAPLLDRARFPTWRYQAGGIVRAQNQAATGDMPVEPAEDWTGRLILKVIDAVRAMEGRPDLPYYLIGHSAGGQALSRLAAFVPNSARRIVIANPSTYVWPTRAERFPYGFGGLPAALADDAAIRRYLAQPVTILLGTADVNRDADLNVREGPERQGTNRHERGLNAFRAARAAAEAHRWPFNWRLIEVEGVAHSARRMFDSPQAAQALGAD
jgi:pimeloyl-ACP methyl ester carboxylesterase